MSIKQTVKKQARRALIAVVKPFPPARWRARMLINNHRRRIYNKIKSQTPTEPRTIIFESFMGRSYSDSPKAVYEWILNDKRFSNYHFIWALRESRLSDNQLYPALTRAEIVQTGTPEYYRAYARAGIWVSNSRLPAYLQPADDQQYIQTWHGTALKRLGYDIKYDGGNAMYTQAELRRKNDLDARRYYSMVSPSPFMTKVYKSAFNLDQINPDCQIWETGLPRNDRLSTYTSNEVRRIKQSLGIPNGKKVILYTPTWRDNQHSAGVGYTYDNQLDFDYLHKQLGDDYVILYRTHYFIANQLDLSQYDDFVYNVSSYEDVNDLYIISDMLITDYSSTFFDYAILRRPIIFFMFDLANYRDNLHGFYLPLASLPGPITQTIVELANAIQHPPEVNKKYRQFVRTYCPYDDGRASQRLANKILDIKRDNKGKVTKWRRI